MSLLKKIVVAGVAVTVILAWSGIGLAQEAPAGGGGGRGQRGAGRMQEMRAQQMQQLKEAMGMTDDEWAAVQPKVEKIGTLRMQTMVGGRQFGRRGGQQQEAEATPLSTASKDLETILADTNATPEQIKATLTAYREAREKARQELAAAQEELRTLLTLRQEAVLVSRGTLD